MTDEQVEKCLWDALKKKKVCFYDMIGLPDQGVDPEPKNTGLSDRNRIRQNRFKTTLGCDRMKELLCHGEFNPYDGYPPLKIPFQDLFRFWWNRCVERDAVVDEVLEDIYDFLREKMRPPEKEKEDMDMRVEFDQMAFATNDLEKAA